MAVMTRAEGSSTCTCTIGSSPGAPSRATISRWRRCCCGAHSRRRQGGTCPSATLARSGRAWRKAWRTLQGGTPPQALLSGGAVIAVVGSDGSGKSTVVGEVSRWLGEFLSVATIHGGKPPPSVPTALPRLLLPLLRRLIPGYRSTRIELRAAVATQPAAMRTGPQLLLRLRALMLASA